MKRLLIIIALLAAILTACGGGGSTVVLPPTAPAPGITEPTPEPTADPTPEPTPEPGKHILAIYNPTAQEIGTSDGEFYYPLGTGKSANARAGFISIDDILHGIDDTGTSIITQRLPAVPDKIAISGADIWIFQDFYDVMSGKDYTKIWLNNSEYGAWIDNRYTVEDAIVTDSGDIIVRDTGEKYRNVQDPLMVVDYAGHGGLLIHSIDIGTRRANIRDASGEYRVPFNENYFLSSKPYIEADGIYYSWNGHTFADGVLTERATIMHEFSTLWYSERPILAAIGSRVEHGEAVTYWLECNTGMMYRHTPSIDLLEEVILLYQSDGTRNSGQIAKPLLKPVLTDEFLFFTWSGTVWKYEFSSGITSSFAAGVYVWGL